MTKKGNYKVMRVEYIKKIQISFFKFGLLAVLLLALTLIASCSKCGNVAIEVIENTENPRTEEQKGQGEQKEQSENSTDTEGDIVQYTQLTETNIIYKTAINGKSMADLKLDIYYPTYRIYYYSPTIVVFHGGSWVSGDKSDIINSLNPLFDRLRENGYTVVTVQYRFASDIIYFPANLEDCIDAILFLSENKDKYNIDPNAIGVAGYSAGAHLAMMCSYAMKTFSVTGDTVNLNYCVSFAGPTKMYEDDASAYSQSILYMLKRLFNGTYEEKADDYRLGSPYHYLSKESQTPLMLVQGDKDDIVPYSQSQVMYEQLNTFGIPCEHITLKNMTHIIDLNKANTFSSPTRDELIDSVERFIYKYTPVK